MHRKHRYLPFLLALVAVVAAVGFYLRPPIWLVLLLVALWLGASWMKRRQYAAFFRGLHLLNQQQFQAAETTFLVFLEQLRQRPDLKKQAKFWYYGAYTPNMEAMTLNNLGVAKMARGQRDEATNYFEQALKTDEKYPKPHHNLAVLAASGGDVELARQHFQKAVELGYDGSTFDQFLEKIRDEYAKTFN